MPSPGSAVVFYGLPYGASTAIAIGNVVMPDTGGGYVVATSANRTLYGRRSTGVAVSSSNGSGLGTFELWQTGTIDNSISGLGAGSASWVRCSATGTIERFTPAPGGSSDIIGKCETDGSVHLEFGVWTEDLATSSGGGGYTPPTGTGFPHITSGTQDGAARAVDLSTSDITGVLPLTHMGAPTGTGFATVTAGAWDAASLAFPLGFVKGGTGLAAIGSGLQYLRVNAGATGLEYATLPAGASVSGTGFWHNTGGSLDAAALAPVAQYDLLIANATPDWVRFAKGSNSTVLQVTAGGVVQYGTVTTAMVAPGGNSTVLQTSSGGAVQWATITPAMMAPGANNTVLITGAGGAVSWTAVNLATAQVTGLLPLANQAAPTGTGYAKVTAGAWAAAAQAVPIPIADGGTNTTGAPGTNAIIQFNGTGYATAPNLTSDGSGLVIAAGSYIRTGSGSYPTTGIIQVANAAADILTVLNVGATTDMTLIANDGSSNGARIGCNIAGTKPWSTIQISPSTSVKVGTTSATGLTVTVSENLIGLPRHGDSNAFSSEGEATLALSGTTQTMAAAMYSRTIWLFTGPNANTDTITVPAPSDADHSYMKQFRITSTNTQVSFSTGSGAVRAFPAPGAGNLIWGYIHVTPEGVFGTGTLSSTLANV